MGKQEWVAWARKKDAQIDELIERVTILEKEANARFKPFIPPTLVELQKYIDEKGYGYVDANKLWEWYDSVGWMRGKQKMRRWKSAVAAWNKKEVEDMRDKAGRDTDKNEGGGW